ncbi:MAG TPA: hypothetical protein VGH80_14110 [Xanthomonadaceae bacterium]|jgi:hypothetical protein
MASIENPSFCNQSFSSTYGNHVQGILAACISLLVVLGLAACASRSAAQTPASAPTAAASPAAAPDFEHPDRSCKVDADCQVKDVGNCCGTYPMCVNKDAAVDPKAVKAQCAREHRFGMCHVMAVGGCSCVQGQCSDINAAQMPRKP